MSAASQGNRSVAIHTISAYHGMSGIFDFSQIICSNLDFSDISKSDQMILSHTPKCYACFAYDRLSKNRF